MAEISARRRHHHRQHRETEISDNNNNTRAIRTTTTPPYEAPSYPLNPSGKVALSALLQGQTLRHLKTHLQHASEKLTDSAGEVNERLTDAKARYERMRERRRNNDNDNNNGNEDGGDDEEDGEEDGEDEEFRKLAQTEERVRSITGELDEGIRGVIDAEVKTEGFVGVVTALAKEEGQSQNQGQGRGGGRRRGGRRIGGDDDQNDQDEEDEEEEEEEDQDENEDEDEDGEREDDYEPRPKFNPASKKLDERLAEDYASWDQHSLTQRYSTNNTYVGFYRIVHESKYPSDELPPLPHASTWFSHLEKTPDLNSRTAETTPTTTTTTQNQNGARNRRTETTTTPDSDNDNNDDDKEDDDDDDDDEDDNDEDNEVAIQRERISLKCPLTLLTFQEPITSTKCRHSFERHAIQDMIQRSPLTVPIPDSATAAGATGGNTARTRGNKKHRVQAVKCPVCAAMLTMDDFVADVALLRRVRRVEAATQREEAEEELDAAVDAANGRGSGRRRRTKGGRKSGITVPSDEEQEQEDDDDRMDVDDHTRIKSERPMSRDSSTMVDG